MEHRYTVNICWTGNSGSGTTNYKTYERSHTISVKGKPVIYGSSDPSFRGDNTCYNPEEMLVASLSACHMLWYLHLCSENGIVVVSYEDIATASMIENNGGGHFTEVMLQPVIILTAGSMVDRARELHILAHKACFIAASVNFPVKCIPIFRINKDRV